MDKNKNMLFQIKTIQINIDDIFIVLYMKYFVGLKNVFIYYIKVYVLIFYNCR